MPTASRRYTEAMPTGISGLMLVVVILVGGVTVPVVGIIHMIAVGQGLMTAVVAVSVAVVVMGEMRQGMLVVVTLMQGMRVPLMDVVHVALVRDGGVPALWPVDVVMLTMKVVPGGHGLCSSLP